MKTMQQEIQKISTLTHLSALCACLKTLYDVARLLRMVPLELWRNPTPVFGAAAFCTTKIDNFRASSKLSSLMTWSTLIKEVDKLE